MNFLNQLTKSISSTNILALDPSINNTGICLLSCMADDITIDYVGLVSTEKVSDEDRITDIVDGVMKSLRLRFSSKDRLVVIIEKPPYTMYNKKLSKNAIIARAANLFRLFSIYGALYHAFSFNGFKTISILPIEWQRKVKRRGFDIKLLSVGLANKRIIEDKNRYHNAPRGFDCWHLHTSKDENIADAINIAFHTWQHREKLLRNIFPELVKQS